MRIKGVPGRVIDWVRSQQSGFGSDDLAKATGLSYRSASIYLSRLERKGIIYRRKKGLYGLFLPTLSRSVRRIAGILLRELPMTGIVVWSTEDLVPYLHYLPNRYLLFLETRSENLPSVRDVLVERGMRVRARPSKRDLRESYSGDPDVLLFSKKDVYGTKPWKGGISTASLERVLVDMYVLTSKKGLAFPTEDVLDALERALKDNAVSRDTLRKYSKRRYVYVDLRRMIEGG